MACAECVSVPRPVYPGDGQMHVYGPRPPLDTAAAAAAASHSSPSTHATTPVQQHPTTVSAVGPVLTPDQTSSQVSSVGPLMTTTQDLQQGTYRVLFVYR